MLKSLIQRTVLGLAVVAFGLPAVAGAQPASCQGSVYNCFMLRAASTDLTTILQAHDLTVVADVRPGEPALKLVTGPGNLLPETTLANVQADSMVVGVELIDSQVVTESANAATIDTAEPSFVTSLSSAGPYSGPEAVLFDMDEDGDSDGDSDSDRHLWNGYMNQPSAGQVKSALAHADPRPEALGVGVVAIIDTGVDPNHPVLQGALVPGYDFLLGQAGDASEWQALSPSTRAQDEADLRAIADQSYVGILDGDGVTVTKGPAAEAVVEQSYVGILDGKELPDGFGHGTMVAGLVRLVAPGALIMPLRVFDGNGNASLGDIIRAIYYAVDAGANVINMSFSTGEYSAELQQALIYAEQNGVVAVASAGNEGYAWTWRCYLPWVSCELRYPAAFPNVLGIASTDSQDVRSDFSNNGLSLVMIGAPGEGVITTYPGGLYAGVWGTSFSAALVSGAVSLMHDIEGSTFTPISYWEAYEAITFSSQGVGDSSLGFGRLDVEHGMNCGLSGGTC